MSKTAGDGDIAVQGLRRVFSHEGKELHVLQGIDVSFRRGEMVSIQGRSGAGKSTFLHILGTLDRPTRGRILFGGKDVFKFSSTQLARFRNANIGFVFQFHHLLPEFTALENVMLPAMINRLPKSECDARARTLLETVGLEHRLAHKPGELSGGEQQRVALARALVMEPSLLLADEPTGNLDRTTGSGIHELFEELNERLNLTIVIVTHDPNLAAQMPRQLYMEQGGLVSTEEWAAGADPADAEPEADSEPDLNAEPEHNAEPDHDTEDSQDAEDDQQSGDEDELDGNSDEDTPEDPNRGTGVTG